jgi:hypothetical protein
VDNQKIDPREHTQKRNLSNNPVEKKLNKKMLSSKLEKESNGLVCLENYKKTKVRNDFY